VLLGFRPVCRNTNAISVICFEEVKKGKKEINVHSYVNRIPKKCIQKGTFSNFPGI
jgi:hypothetical protein